MLTKADFQAAIKDTVASYPTIAQLYAVGDPRIMQHLDAMATMLSMLSAQIEVAAAEPFDKVRDSTVLADAAMRGIVPKAIPCHVRITLKNNSTAAYTVVVGRNFVDSAGLLYRAETSVTISPGGQGMFEAKQMRFETVTHTVVDSEPFYAIEIPPSDDDASLCSIDVSDTVGSYLYRDRYVNTAAGEKIYHIEADENQKTYVRFGYAGVVGYQPPDGTVITLKIGYTNGEISVSPNSPFSFAEIYAPQEMQLEMVLDSVLMAGSNPPSISTLRELSKYPSIYQAQAVFIGEFDFLVRRNFPNLKFLSVWNETAEERARGKNINNINTLFVAVFDSQEIVRNEAAGTTVQPIAINSGYYTVTQNAIKNLITAADDSYKVRFYTPVRFAIPIQISATISTSYSATLVKEQIIDALLLAYGEDAAGAKRGRMRILYKQVYNLLKEKIPALTYGDADLQVQIGTATAGERPELWQYVTRESLTVFVYPANIIKTSWGT